MKKILLICLIILSSIFHLQADSWTFHHFVDLENVHTVYPTDSDHFFINNNTVNSFWKIDKTPISIFSNNFNYPDKYKVDSYNNLWVIQDSTGFAVYKNNEVEYIPCNDTELVKRFYKVSKLVIDGANNKYILLNGGDVFEYNNHGYKQIKIQIADSTYESFTDIVCTNTGKMYFKNGNTYFYKQLGIYQKWDMIGSLTFIGFGSQDKMYFVDNKNLTRIVVYENGQFIKEIRDANNQSNFSFNNTFVNKNDEILEKYNNRFARYYNGISWTEYDLLAYGSSLSKTTVDRNGVFWLTTPNGLLLFDKGKITLKKSINYGLSASPTSIVQQGDSMLISCRSVYSSTSNFPLNIFTNGKYSEMDSIPNNKIKQDLIKGENGILYGRIDYTVFEFRNSIWDTLKINNQVVKATKIYKSKSGEIWFLYFGKLNKYDGVNLTTIEFAESLYFNFSENITITEDKLGNIWVSAYQKGVYKYDGTSWINYTDTNIGLIQMQYNEGIVFDKNNILYVATQGGLIIYDGVNWTLMDTANSNIPSNAFIGIAIDQNDVIWLNDYFQHIIKYDHGVFSKFTNTILNTDINQISVDENNNKCFFTVSSLIIYNEKDAPPPPSVIPTSTQIQLYPNPFLTEFYIDALQVGDIVKVYNLQGQKVVETNIKTEGKNTINVSQLPNGLYLVDVYRNNQKMYSSKINKHFN